MKKVFYKISSTLVVIGLVILLYFFSGYMQNFEMTEEEAAKAVFDYIYSDCDYDYDAKVISTMQQGEMVYLYQTQEKSYRAKIGQKMGNIMSLHTIHVM